jgi:hypothetical protein
MVDFEEGRGVSLGPGAKSGSVEARTERLGLLCDLEAQPPQRRRATLRSERDQQKKQ